MDGIQALLNAQLTMFLYLGVGFLCRKLGYSDAHTENGLATAVTNIVLPCMIFDAMLKALGDMVLSEVLLVAAICVFIMVLSYFIGWVIYRRKPENEKPVFIYSIMNSNSAFVGLPMIAAVYGEQGVFYAAIYMTVARLFVWTLGLKLFTRDDKGHGLRCILLNPNNIAVALAMAVHFLAIPIPKLLADAVSEIGGTSTLLCMVMVGSLIGSLHWRQMLRPAAYGYSALRLIGIPLLTFGALTLLGIQPVILGAMVILVAAPAPTLACVMSARYGADKELAAVLVLVSTALSFVTQPLMAMLCL